MSPILVADGSVPKSRIAEQFKAAVAPVEPIIVRMVLSRVEESPG
jgi:hypothetical protein